MYTILKNSYLISQINKYYLIIIKIKMDKKSFQKYIEKMFTYNTLPYLMDFIRIPNLSPNFDFNWRTNGLLEKAANFIMSYIQSLQLKNAETNLIQDKGYSPLIFMEISPTRPNDSRTILFYAHFDKQPHGTGWDDNKGPTKPVIENNHLYGRGTADDGYAIFSILTSMSLSILLFLLYLLINLISIL